MIVHEAVGVTEPVVAFIDEGKDFEECLSILVVLEYGFFIIATIGDVINRSGVFNAKWTGHEGSLSEDYIKVKQYRPDPKEFAEGKISVGSFYHEVIMIVHEAVGVTEPVVA